MYQLIAPSVWSTGDIIPKATIRWQDNDVVASSLNRLWNFRLSSHLCLVSTSFLSPSHCISLSASVFLIFYHMNEPVQHGESRVSSESRRALFSAMLFLLLFHCSNTQMDSPLHLEQYVCLSVFSDSARLARKASPLMCTEITLGILDGNFQSHSSCCEMT